MLRLPGMIQKLIDKYKSNKREIVDDLMSKCEKDKALFREIVENHVYSIVSGPVSLAITQDRARVEGDIYDAAITVQDAKKGPLRGDAARKHLASCHIGFVSCVMEFPVYGGKVFGECTVSDIDKGIEICKKQRVTLDRREDYLTFARSIVIKDATAKMKMKDYKFKSQDLEKLVVRVTKWKLNSLRLDPEG